MRRPRVEDAYRLAWRGARRLPTGLGYALTHTAGTALWARQRLLPARGGVGQLERNLARIAPAGTPRRRIRALSRAGMRSYMRYFYEAFALPGASAEQIQARVRADLPPTLREDLQRGSVVLALAHMGNWDLAGAWASAELASVLTVAERLEPADLFDQFVDFRTSLGMRVIGQGHGEKVFEPLVAAAAERRHLVALLADRDLSSAGIDADLLGHTIRAAAGPAALAHRLGAPLYATAIHYERLTGERRRRAGARWGIVLTLVKVPVPEATPPGEGRDSGDRGDGSSSGDNSDHSDSAARALIAAWTRAWVAALAPSLAEHPEDWHMLQPVYDADLDHERLARRHAREQEESA